MRTYGERALLIDTDSPLALAAATRELPGVVDVVPGDGSVLVVFANPSLRSTFELPHALNEPQDGPLVELPVTYDGADLDEVAAACGMTRAEVIEFAGDVLQLGRDAGPPELAPAVETEAALTVLPGPRPEQFPADALAHFCRQDWRISDQVDRTGVRLTGASVPRLVDEARPEGLVSGAIQVPPSGEPIVLLADHPLTGGYPVLGVVSRASLRELVQLLPGGAVSFRSD